MQLYFASLMLEYTLSTIFHECNSELSIRELINGTTYVDEILININRNSSRNEVKEYRTKSPVHRKGTSTSKMEAWSPEKWSVIIRWDTTNLEIRPWGEHNNTIAWVRDSRVFQREERNLTE